jgi:hypothetical protein
VSDAIALQWRAAFWARIQKHQPIADQYCFGSEWRALIETRTMEAARAADFRLHLIRINIDEDDESDEANSLAEMQSLTASVMSDLQNKVREVKP